MAFRALQEQIARLHAPLTSFPNSDLSCFSGAFPFIVLVNLHKQSGNEEADSDQTQNGLRVSADCAQGACSSRPLILEMR